MVYFLKNFLKSLILIASINNVIALSESIYDFKLNKADGTILDLSQYRDSSKQVLLFINVASQCGYTDSNYKFFEKLANTYKDNLEIIAIPCNQFGNQEPHSDESIMRFVEGRYNLKVNSNDLEVNSSPSIQMLSKTLVNGDDSSDLIKFLKLHTRGFDRKDIPWNFNKFLVIKWDTYHLLCTRFSIENYREGYSISSSKTSKYGILINWKNLRNTEKKLLN